MCHYVRPAADSVRADKCDEDWFPFSQSAELVRWGDKRHEEQLQKAAEVLETFDPSHDDYQEKATQAAGYALEFEEEFQEKYEQILKRRVSVVRGLRIRTFWKNTRGNLLAWNPWRTSRGLGAICCCCFLKMGCEVPGLGRND